VRGALNWRWFFMPRNKPPEGARIDEEKYRNHEPTQAFVHTWCAINLPSSVHACQFSTSVAHWVIHVAEILSCHDGRRRKIKGL
jgi:hypothetical protein